MRCPNMSTGAWIFASVIAASVIAPTAVYAAATSTVAIGNVTGSATATVTAQHQLLTTPIAPNRVIRVDAVADGVGCAAVYTPPAGKAIVVTDVTWALVGPTGGTTAYLEDADCSNHFYDTMVTAVSSDTQQHVFPTGLPLPSVGVFAATSGGLVSATISGYVVPASELPAAAAGHGPMPLLHSH